LRRTRRDAMNGEEYPPHIIDQSPALHKENQCSNGNPIYTAAIHSTTFILTVQYNSHTLVHKQNVNGVICSLYAPASASASRSSSRQLLPPFIGCTPIDVPLRHTFWLSTLA
jgi:hypothetical protein